MIRGAFQTSVSEGEPERHLEPPYVVDVLIADIGPSTTQSYSAKYRFAALNAVRLCNRLQPFIEQARYGRNQARRGVRYWQRRPLSLDSLFNDKAQDQKRYWPNSYPNSNRSA